MNFYWKLMYLYMIMPNKMELIWYGVYLSTVRRIIKFTKYIRYKLPKACGGSLMISVRVAVWNFHYFIIAVFFKYL